MGEVRVDTVIEATPNAVWTVLSDVGVWADWNELFVDGRCDGGKGSLISCRISVGPIWFPVKAPLLSWDVDQGLSWGEDMGIVLRVHHGFVIEPVENGCRVVHFERFEGIVGRMVFPLVRGVLTRNYQGFLDALKAKVER